MWPPPRSRDQAQGCGSPGSPCRTTTLAPHRGDAGSRPLGHPGWALSLAESRLSRGASRALGSHSAAMRTRGSRLRSPQGAWSGGDPGLQTQVPGALGDERASAPSRKGLSEARVGGLGGGGHMAGPQAGVPCVCAQGAWGPGLGGQARARTSASLPTALVGPAEATRRPWPRISLWAWEHRPLRMGLKTPPQTRRRPGSPGCRPRWTGSPCLP